MTLLLLLICLAALTLSVAVVPALVRSLRLDRAARDGGTAGSRTRPHPTDHPRAAVGADRHR